MSEIALNMNRTLQLECSCHVERNFKEKFLTWFSLIRVTVEQINGVPTFIHALKDHSVALGEQLVDYISRKNSTIGGGSSSSSSGVLSMMPRNLLEENWLLTKNTSQG